MTNRDRETTVVHTGGSSGAGWFIAGAIVIAAIIAGFFLYGGVFDGGGDKVNIEMQAPKVDTPAGGNN